MLKRSVRGCVSNLVCFRAFSRPRNALDDIVRTSRVILHDIVVTSRATVLRTAAIVSSNMMMSIMVRYHSRGAAVIVPDYRTIPHRLSSLLQNWHGG